MNIEVAPTVPIVLPVRPEQRPRPGEHIDLIGPVGKEPEFLPIDTNGIQLKIGLQPRLISAYQSYQQGGILRDIRQGIQAALKPIDC
jgi:hypothetical protein